MKAKHFVQHHANHHHIHTGVWLVRVGHLACMLQGVHEGLQLDIASLEGVG